MNAREILHEGATLALPSGDRNLLVLLTTADAAEARKAWRTWKGDHPLDDATSRELRVLPAVTERLLAFGVDDPDLGRLRGIIRFHWLWSQRVTRAGLEAAQILREEGIEVVALKGLALHALGVASMAQRPITDADLLVSADPADACRFLAKHGWTVVRRQQHAWACRRGPQEDLDVHRYSIHQDPRSGAWTLERSTSPGRGPLGVPTPAHLVLHACWHGVRGDGSLLWLADCLRIIAHGNVDWDELLNLARLRRLALLLSDALGVVGRRVPERVLHELRAIPVSTVEALEYAATVGCLAEPWAAPAERASRILRELRRYAQIDDAELKDAEARIPWDPIWPSRWRRPGLSRSQGS